MRSTRSRYASASTRAEIPGCGTWPIPGIGHGLPPDGSIPILKWLTSHKRKPWPKKVIWEPAVAWRKSFFWLRKEKPGGGTIIAENLGGNHFEVKAEGNPTDLSILLSGEINKAQAQRVISRLVLFEDASDEPIKVFIDSPGCDADAGYAIFDMMRFVKPPVYMIGMGLVASAAAIILLAARL